MLAVSGVQRSIEEVLAATALFSAAASDTIAELARSARRRTIQRDEMLFAAGERATSIYVIDSGAIDRRHFLPAVTGHADASEQVELVVGRFVDTW